MSVEIARITNERFEMRYFRFGSGERNMVIIPGVSIRSVMESAAVVKYAYDMFSRDFTVFVLDRITVIPKGYSLRDMSEDTAEALGILGIRDAYIMGASQGGMIAQYIAAEHPELVKKLVLAATASRSGEISSRIFDKAEELASQGRSSELNLMFCERIYSKEFFEKFRGVIEASAALITPGDLERFIGMTSGINGFDLSGELEKISCETLVVCGSDDRIFGTAPSEELAERLGCELCIFEGCGHAVYDEAEGFKDKMYDFFMS